MTSELLILTPHAVTLAADSAVTINNRKTYNGVNKLFMLSNNPPMGIMTYNLATFIDIPIETLIKEFRDKINEKEVNFLEDFKNEFNHYLKNLIKNYPFKNKKFETDLFQFIEQISKESAKLTNEEFKNIIKQNSNQFNKDELGEFYNDIMSKLNIHESCFEQIHPNIKEDNEFLKDLKNFFISKVYLNSFVGIVIAGFEKNKLFPSSIHFKINYLYDDKFILKVIEKNEVNGSQVFITPFAQGDVIHTFLNSIDNLTEKIIIEYFNKVHQEYPIKLKDAINENNSLSEDEKTKFLNLTKKIKTENNNLTRSFIDFIKDLKYNHNKPILSSIASLPKEELSNLAESLIKITSLKRKVQTDLETVGGPIDVAIITKGDGFIWTKRKHYFKSELNPQFFNKR